LSLFQKVFPKKDLSTNKLVQNAIVRQIEVIGEAVKNLPIDCTVKYPYVDWSNIARTRDKLIHHYFGVDLEVVWSIVKDDLPQLKKDIVDIIEKERKKKSKT
jgi:uncharacterized protein with HEPN domain